MKPWLEACGIVVAVLVVLGLMSYGINKLTDPSPHAIHVNGCSA